MPSIVAQKLSKPVVQQVIATLDADEVFQVVNALNAHGYTYLGAQFRALLDVDEPKTPDAYLATGAEDRNIREGRRVLATKNTRANSTAAGLSEALEAVKKRSLDIGVPLR